MTINLSPELISMFAKITNDNKKDKSETVLYGTAIIQNGNKYVRIDGSNIVTPVSSTADIETGARVTVMLKDHNAVVTGNLTDPSASSDGLAIVAEYTADINKDTDERITYLETVIGGIPEVDDLALIHERLEAVETTLDGGITEDNVSGIKAIKIIITTIDGTSTTTIQSWYNELTNQITYDEQVIDGLLEQTTEMETTVTDLSTRLETAETTVTDLSTRLETAETTVVGLATRLETAETTITDLIARIEALENK